jgi:hypothetical protein
MLLLLPLPRARADVLAVSPFKLSKHAARAIADRRAADRHAVRLRPGGWMTARAGLTTDATALQIVARGVRCHGAPLLRVAVDGHRVVSRHVGRRYRTVSVDVRLAPGEHRVHIAQGRRHARGCRPALVVDSVAFVVADAAAGPTPVAAAGAPVPPAPAPTTAPTPQPAPAPATGTKLRWAPPPLSSPITIAVGQGDQFLALDVTKDYILQMPSVPHLGSITIDGGHNVVMIGGHEQMRAGQSGDAGLVVRDNTGTVHLEGLQIDPLAGAQYDAIQIASPASVVQIENVRAMGLRGSYSSNHTDVVQPYGGVKDLRIDHLTASTNYQGLFLRPDAGPIGSIELQNIDITYDNVAPNTGGYLLWLTTGCTTAPVSMSKVYLKPRSGWSLGKTVWPDVTDAKCPALLKGTTVAWPKLPVSGVATLGPAPSGAFVPWSGAGIGYVAAGYQ